MSQVFKPSWATADPATMGVSTDIHSVANLVGGKWTDAKSRMTIPDPLDRDAQPIFTIPDTQVDELGPFFESLRKVSKSGVHNPLKNPDRYVKYGEISRKVRILTAAVNFGRKTIPTNTILLY
jgi:1-pyrroline-5-carboxylate dehydrogenase